MIFQPIRTLHCDTCEKRTPHALNYNHTHYVCGCGTQVIYIVNNGPHLWAI